MKILKSLPQIYQCLLKNISLQNLTTELKQFTFLLEITFHLENHKFFTKNKEELNIVKTRYQNFLLKKWNESKRREDESLNVIKSGIEKILLGKKPFLKKKSSSKRDLYNSGKSGYFNSGLVRKMDLNYNIENSLNKIIKNIDNVLGIKNDTVANYQDINNLIQLLYDKSSELKNELSSFKSDITSQIESGTILDSPELILETKLEAKKNKLKNQLMDMNSSPPLKKLSFMEERNEKEINNLSYREMTSVSKKKDYTRSFHSGTKNVESVETLEKSQYENLRYN